MPRLLAHRHPPLQPALLQQLPAPIDSGTAYFKGMQKKKKSESKGTAQPFVTLHVAKQPFVKNAKQLTLKIKRPVGALTHFK